LRVQVDERDASLVSIIGTLSCSVTLDTMRARGIQGTLQHHEA
jgi:hypothetical protein